MSLLSICGVAFLAVFVILIVLALVIRGITAAFPERVRPVKDAAWVAAVSVAMQTVFPGARVTEIKEQP